MTGSFKAAARFFKNSEKQVWSKSLIAAQICDMAHAISRRRNPSVSTGENSRIWWRDHAFDYNCGVNDYMGEPCDIFTYLYEWANDCGDLPSYMALREAISLCWKHFNRVGWPKHPLTDEEKRQKHQDWLDRKYSRHFDLCYE